jgi:regulator of replication initiation timing
MDPQLPETKNTSVDDQEYAHLCHELELIQAENRLLNRQLKKAQDAAAEAIRAHTKMVATLTETMRENAALVIERDAWKHRAQRFATEMETEQQRDISQFPGLQSITEAEARVIRKAMARLHHPDSGGNPDRMKAWNAVLDLIEHGS